MLTKITPVRYSPPLPAVPGEVESLTCPVAGGGGFGAPDPGSSGAPPGTGVIMIGGCYLVTAPCGDGKGNCGHLVCP